MFCKEDVRLSISAQTQAFLNEGKSQEDINTLFHTNVFGEDGGIHIPEDLIDKYWEVNQPETTPEELQSIEDSEDQQYYDAYQEHGDVLDTPRSVDQLEDSLDHVESLNDEYPDIHFDVSVQGDKHTIYPTPKSELPSEYKRVEVDNDLTPKEHGSRLMNKVLYKLQNLFPDFKYHIVEQEEADRIAGELGTGTVVNSVIKGNELYFVRGSVTPEMAAEEFLHPFVNHLFNNDRELFNNLSRQSLSLHPELNEVYNTYRDKLGEEDALQEVVARVLGKEFVKAEEKQPSFLKRFITWLRKLFKSFKVSGIPNKITLEELARKISDKELKMDYLTKGSNSFNISIDNIKDLWERIASIAKNAGITKIGDKEGYVDKAGNPLTRITDVAKQVYKNDFGKNTKPEDLENRAENEVSAERGTQFHKDMENMFRLYIDPYTGKKRYTTLSERDAIDTSSFSPSLQTHPSFTEEYVRRINDYVKEKLDTYSPNARFLFETVVYNEQKNVAGTVDFIAIDDGGIDILDWKSIYKLSPEGKIYATKKKAFNIQLGEYYNAIKYSLGLSDNDFNEIRVIPIRPTKDDNGNITSLRIGAVKPTGNEEISLLPILSSKDVKFRTTLKPFVDGINGVLKKDSERIKRETGVSRSDWELKQELDEAIQQVATQQNPDELFLFIDEILSRTDKYLEQVHDYTGEINDETLDLYSRKFDDADKAVKALSSFLSFAKDNLADYLEEPSQKQKVNNYTVKIIDYTGRVKKGLEKWLEKVAISQGITGINKPQVEISTSQRWTKFFMSNPATKSIQLFSKLYRNNDHRIHIRTTDAQIRTLKMSDSLQEWGKSHGKTMQDIYKWMMRPKSFLLQSKLSDKFYEEREKAFGGTKQEKLKFFKDNYDVPAYNTAVNEYLKGEFEKIEAEVNGNPDLTDERKNEVISRRKENLEKKYLTSKYADTALTNSNYFLNLKNEDGKYVHLKQENWYSDFYKEMQDPVNKPVSDFYNYLLELNRQAKQTGLMPENSSDYFVPQVLKGMLETGWDMNAQLKRYLTTLSANPNDHEYGKMDLITKLPIDKMFLPYTIDLSTKDKDGKRDYSGLSNDLLKSFLGFETALIDIQEKQHLESFINLLTDAEQANAVISVNRFGTPQKKQDSPDEYATLNKGLDSNNFKALNAYRKYILFGQRTQDITDKLLKTPFKDSEGKPIYISGARFIESVASFNRQAVIGGLNVFAPLRNFVVGRLSTVVQSSPYTSVYRGNSLSTVSLKNYAGFLEEFRFNPKNPRHNKIAGSLLYFLPNLLHTSKIQDKVSLHAAWQILTPENMMHILQKSEELISIPVHLTMMDNSTIRDGKIVNINDLVREEFRKEWNTTNIYSYLNNLSKSDRNAAEKEMDNRVKELRKDNLWEYMDFDKDNNFTVRGIDQMDESVGKVRRVTHDIVQKSTGTGRDHNLTQTNQILRMLMMFRSWIPRTVQARTGRMNMNNNTDMYEEGRMRSLVKYALNCHNNNFKKFGKLIAGFVGIHDPKNIQETIDKLYTKKVQEMQQLNKIDRASEISPEEFTRMYMDNIDSAYRDLRATATLMLLVTTGILAATGGGSGDEPDSTTVRVFERELAKYSQEFTFYYDPTASIQMLKNPFPITGFYTNLSMFFDNVVKLPFNYDKAHPSHYFFKSLPLSSFFVQYMPLFDNDVAKEWNIHVSQTLFNR